MSIDNSFEDIYLERLHKIIEEIPSGVRDQDFESILKVKNSQELLRSNNNNIILCAKQWLNNNVWENFDVSKKLAELFNIIENPDSAWRPTTGEVNISPILADSLRKRKNQLEDEIKKIRDQSSTLKNELINSNSVMNNHVHKMKNFCLNNLESNKNHIQKNS